MEYGQGQQFPGYPNFEGPLPGLKQGQGQQFPGYPNFEGPLPGMEYGGQQGNPFSGAKLKGFHNPGSSSYYQQ